MRPSSPTSQPLDLLGIRNPVPSPGPSQPLLTLPTPESGLQPAVPHTPGSLLRDGPGSCASTGGYAGDAYPLPPLRDRLHLVVDFFRHIHPLVTYAFLYEEAIVQRCMEETIDEALIYAICAHSALLLGYPKYPPATIAAWTAHVERIIWAGLEQPTIFKTQALLLTVQYHSITGNFQRAFMLHSLAARSATALRLTYERTDLSPLAQEIRRRLVWALCVSDGVFAIGLPECELVPYEVVHLKMPCPEEVFNADCCGTTDVAAAQSLDGVAEGGLLAAAIQGYRVRRDLLRLKRELELATQPLPRLVEVVEEFTEELQRISSSAYSRTDLLRYSRSRWIARYVGIHLSWHQCHCDLFRLFLSGYRESAPEVIINSLPEGYVSKAVALCLRHAQAIIRILKDINNLNPRLQVAGPDLAICGYHACRLVLFISRSHMNPPDSGITEPIALDAATSTMDIIKIHQSNSAIGNLLIRELGRLIQSYSTGQDDDSRGSSDADDDHTAHQPRYATVAKQRQGLGVHSILRQARFLDDSAVAAQRSGIRLAYPAGAEGGLGSRAGNQLLEPSAFQWQFSPLDNLGSGGVSLPHDSVAPTSEENMTLLPQTIFESATFGPDPWGPWQDGAGLNEWVAQDDGNYF